MKRKVSHYKDAERQLEFRVTTVVRRWQAILKEQYPVTAHAPNFDYNIARKFA